MIEKHFIISYFNKAYLNSNKQSDAYEYEFRQIV